MRQAFKQSGAQEHIAAITHSSNVDFSSLWNLIFYLCHYTDILTIKLFIIVTFGFLSLDKLFNIIVHHIKAKC